jgi:hypothetical protein
MARGSTPKSFNASSNFIRSGGMDRAREKQINELQRARRNPSPEVAASPMDHPTPRNYDAYDPIFDAVWWLGRTLFEFLLKR